jgi:hypothetical protein
MNDDAKYKYLCVPCFLCGWNVFRAKKLLRQRRFYHLNDLGKPLGIGDGHIGEDFAVELDLGLDQASDEFAVAQAVHSGGSVDADDPQLAEFALPVVTVAVGEYAGAYQCFLGRAEQFPTTADEAFDFLEETFFGPRTRGAFYSAHAKNSQLLGENQALPGRREAFVSPFRLVGHS